MLYYVSLAKSVGVLSKKFASFNRRKLLCKLKVSNYQCTGKIAWKNKSRYIPSIIIIYHCYHRITLLLFFTYHPTNTARVFPVETTSFNVEYTWFVRRADALRIVIFSIQLNVAYIFLFILILHSQREHSFTKSCHSEIQKMLQTGR